MTERAQDRMAHITAPHGLPMDRDPPRTRPRNAFDWNRSVTVRAMARDFRG